MKGMTAAEIITDVRRQVGDTVKPYFRSDELFLADLNEAVREACRRARLIVDSTTPEVCELAVNAGDVTVDLDQRIIFVRRVKWRGRALPLRKIRREDLDQQCPGWEDDSSSEPSHYVAGLDSGAIRPYPTPTVDGYLDLTVVREPMCDIKQAEVARAEPEIAPRQRRGLGDWLRWRYYSMQDPDVSDPKSADAALASFTAQFGAASTAVDETWIDQHNGIDEAEGLY
jgi:hypothetical protein